MKRNIIGVGLAALSLVGSFLPMASAGNYFISISHIGDLAWLLYPLAFTALGLGITSVYKPDLPFLRLWIGVVTLAGLTLTAISVSAGISSLESMANLMSPFSFLRENQEQAEKVSAIIGTGGAMAVTGYLGLLLLNLLPTAARTDKREVEQ